MLPPGSPQDAAHPRTPGGGMLGIDGGTAVIGG